MEILLALVAGLVIGFAAMMALVRRRSTLDPTTLDQLATKLQQHLATANEQLILLANEKLGAERQVINTDLANKKEAIEQLMQTIQRDLRQTEQSRIQDYTKLTAALTNHQQLTDQLATTTDNLRRVLSNNQARGQFGEQVAEELLKMNGFSRGTDYEFNKTQEEGSARPDFAVFLPDGTRINVDAKFPYQNYQRAVEATDDEQRQRFFQLFTQDVKQKIKQVTDRSYINPEERTVDFVIVFIPNEMIFSVIYDKMNAVWTEAMKQKVVLAGPFNFIAILRMIRQAHETFRYQKNIPQTIQLIKEFEEEFMKFNGEFKKVGERLSQAAQQFEKTEGTRSRVLLRKIERLKQIEPPADDQPLLTDSAK